MDNTFKYYAFISYKREDEEWAKWLQHKLEHYKLPSNLNGRTDLPKEIRPVFKDTSELNPGNLPQQIHDALEQSKHLIIICSPRSAKSEWVNKEVETFIEMGKTDQIIPFIIDGKAFAKNPEEECFPKAIRDLPSEQEILGANIGEMGRDAAAVKVVAQMFGLKFDELWQRHEREQRRKRNWIIAASIIGFLVMAGVTFWMYTQRQQTLKANWKMMENHARFVSEKARTIAEEDSYLARLLLLEILPEDLGHPIRPYIPEAEAALREICNRNTFILRPGETFGQFDRVVSAVFSPDGKQIVTASENKTLKIWDVSSGQQLQTIEGTSQFHFASFSPDGKQIISASGWGINGDNNVKIWDAKSGQLLKTLEGHSDRVTHAVFSPNGEKIVSVSEDRTLKFWDAKSGQLIKTIEGEASIYSAAFSPDGSQVVLVYGYPKEENTVIVWDAETGLLLKTMIGSPASRFASFSPDGKQVVSASEDGTVMVWDASSGELLRALAGHTDVVSSVAFSPDGEKIVSASYDNTARLWDAATGQVIKVLKGHSHTVAYAEFSPNGKLIASASWDNTSRIWDVGTEQSRLTLVGHLDFVNTAKFSPDGKYIVSASNDKTIRVWDAITGQQTLLLEGHNEKVRFAFFSPDGKQIVSASDDKTIRVWDAASGQQALVMEGTSCPYCALYSLDGKRLLSAWSDNTIIVWDAALGVPVQTQVFDIDDDYFRTFSPDGKQIVSAIWGDITIWDVATRQPVHTLKGHIDIVQDVSYSPNGEKLVSASWDNTVRVWDAISGQIIQVLDGQAASVITFFSAASFNPDGKLVVASTLNDNDSNSIILWDATTGRPIQTFIGHTESANSVSFSPNGRQIVSASFDNTVRIWDFPPLQDLIDQTRERFKDRPLTPEERRMYYLE